MAGKISDLTAATAVASADQWELLQGGTNKRVASGIAQAPYAWRMAARPGQYMVSSHAPGAAALTGLSDLMLATPVYIPPGTTADAMLYRCTTGQAGNAKMAIYSPSTTAGATLALPDARIAITNGAAMAAGANVIALTTNPLCDLGWYWLAILFDTATATVIMANSNASFPGCIVGSTTADRVLNTSGLITGWTGVGTYAGGFPSSFGTASERASATPICAVRAL